MGLFSHKCANCGDYSGSERQANLRQRHWHGFEKARGSFWDGHPMKGETLCIVCWNTLSEAQGEANGRGHVTI